MNLAIAVFVISYIVGALLLVRSISLLNARLDRINARLDRSDDRISRMSKLNSSDFKNIYSDIAELEGHYRHLEELFSNQTVELPTLQPKPTVRKSRRVAKAKGSGNARK